MEKASFLNAAKDFDDTQGPLQGNIRVTNEPGIGNMHLVQMIFKDGFEVCGSS